MKSYTSSARLERDRAICHSRSASRPSRPAVASTSRHSVISSARSPRPSARPAREDQVLLPLRAAYRRRNRLPASRCWRRQSVLSARQCTIRERGHDTHLEPRLRRMGRGLRRSRCRYCTPRSATSPRYRHSDRGFELSPPSARRSCTRAHPFKCHGSIVDRADQASGPTAKNRRS